MKIYDEIMEDCKKKGEYKEVKKMRNQTLAYVRKDLIGEVPTSIQLTFEEQRDLKFKCYIDEFEHTHEEGYNLLLVHPVSGDIFWGLSIDFDYETIEEFYVIIKETSTYRLSVKASSGKEAIDLAFNEGWGNKDPLECEVTEWMAFLKPQQQEKNK